MQEKVTRSIEPNLLKKDVIGGTGPDAAGAHEFRGLGVRVGRRVAAVLGEFRHDVKGVGCGNGPVCADARGARASEKTHKTK